MIAKPTVYLETSIISYLTSRLSNDYLISAHQRLTLEWWEQRRNGFQLVVSDVVIKEIAAGDPLESRKRLNFVASLPVYETTEEIRSLVQQLIKARVLPAKAVEDAFHIAIAAMNGVEVLLTWNCKHLANVNIERAITGFLQHFGYQAPLICTPLELMEDDRDE